jgi:sec-independent protein translocase protein TatA
MNMIEPTALAFLGWTEVAVILLVLLLFFGAKKLPELAKGLGKGIQEFKKASRDVQDEFQRAVEEEPPASRPPAKPAPPATTSPTQNG